MAKYTNTRCKDNVRTLYTSPISYILCYVLYIRYMLIRNSLTKLSLFAVYSNNNILVCKNQNFKEY